MVAWSSDTQLELDGAVFVLAPTDYRSGRDIAGRTGAQLLRKPRWMVERYEALCRQIRPVNVVELGIYDGGGTAFLALIFRPGRLVAVDISPDRVAPLDDFIEQRGLQDRVHPYFGVDQGDRSRLERIVADEFGSEPLDLVIDDASHLVDPTTASFNLLFPRLRPGGLFVIEDWSWQHYRDEAVAKALMADERLRVELSRRLESGDASPSETPLSRLVLELVLTAGYDERIVAEVTSLQRGWVVVRRGPAELDRETFDVSQCYGSLGRSLLA
jgi:predicted O-methyltransferase YrrM